MNVTRSVVFGVVGPCKTESSQKPVPLHPLLAETLVQWQERSAKKSLKIGPSLAGGMGAGNRAGDTRSYAGTFGQRQIIRELKNASHGILFVGPTRHF
jgi:hypothetical protein